MKIYLDDTRSAPEGWVRTYTAAQTIAILESGLVEELSLDHDLGEGNGTGYDVCLWLEEAVHSGFKPPAKISVHSANPAGAQRMRAAITKIKQLAPKQL